MRSLYLVRHAKSSWDNPDLKDIDRPLNKRGKSDAPKMGKLLKTRGDIPELIISSPAKRTKSTAKRIAAETGFNINDIKINDLLYMAGIDDFISVIKKVNDKIHSLMIVSHNFGITDFANYISSSDINNIPTCGIVKIDFNFNYWENIKSVKGILKYFEYPKKYPDGV